MRAADDDGGRRRGLGRREWRGWGTVEETVPDACDSIGSYHARPLVAMVDGRLHPRWALPESSRAEPAFGR